MKQDKCVVSVIMAAYNAQNSIEAAIRSVLSQTFQNWELIIINDCAVDQTGNIAYELSKNESRIFLLENEKNLGVSASRQRGVECAKGEWIAVLDSDDMWEPAKLEKQLSLAVETNAELIFTGSAYMDENGNRLPWVLHVPRTLDYKKLLRQNLISNSSVMVKKELYQRYYAIGDDMHEDFALWLRITKTGRVAVGIDEPLLIYRISSSSKSGNKFKAFKMNWNTYKYVGLNPALAAYNMVWYTINGILKYRHFL